MNARNEAMLVDIYPPFAAVIRTLAHMLELKYNNEVTITQSLRTSAEQDALYAKIPKVTNARGGYSMHNFGLAVDLCPSKIDGTVWTPDWVGTDEHYAHMVAEGAALKLNCGANWHSFKDEPHFQVADIPTTPTDGMRGVLASGGLKAVFAAVAAGQFKV